MNKRQHPNLSNKVPPVIPTEYYLSNHYSRYLTKKYTTSQLLWDIAAYLVFLLCIVCLGIYMMIELGGL